MTATNLTGTGLRAGFLGGGFMARVHSRPARSAGATLKALSASSLARAEQAAEELGIVAGAADEADVLTLSDVVHVCTPNVLHAHQALAAIAAGRHVICEKPLATSKADARPVADAAAAAGVVGAVPFVYRYYPMVRRARRLVATGIHGVDPVVVGNAEYSATGVKRGATWR